MDRKPFLLIFVIALVIRLMVAISSRQLPSYDSAGYDNRAMNILTGRGFSGLDGKLTSFKEPLYPFFLASVYYIFGHNYTIVRIIQSILGILVCIFIFLIAKKIFNRETALISFLIAALNPALIKISEHLLTENLYIFLLMIAIYFFVNQSQEKDFKNLILLGVTLGIAALTRSVILYFPLFVLLLRKREEFIYGGLKIRKYILSIFIFVLCFFLPIVPWTLRNWRIHHKLIPIDTKAGLVLYSSYFPPEGKLLGFTADDENTRFARRLNSEGEASKFLLLKTWERIKELSFARIFKLEILKFIYFWSPFDWEIIGYRIYNFMYGFIIPFFLCGIFINFKKFKKLLPVYLPIIYTFAISLITYGSPRLRLTIEPFLIILGAATIVHLYTRSIRQKLFIISVFILFCLNFLFFIYSDHFGIFTKSIVKFLGLWG